MTYRYPSEFAMAASNWGFSVGGAKSSRLSRIDACPNLLRNSRQTWVLPAPGTPLRTIRRLSCLESDKLQSSPVSGDSNIGAVKSLIIKTT